MIHNITKLGMKKGALSPLSLFLKIICVLLLCCLSSCATPPKKPIYSASGEILPNGEILRVWRKDNADGSPEKIQYIINNRYGKHAVLQRLNYSYQLGKLSQLVSLEYATNGLKRETVLHFNLAGQLIFKQNLINNLASSPSSQQIKQLLLQQKKLLNVSNSLKKNDLKLSQGLYTQSGVMLNCDIFSGQSTPNTTGVAWVTTKNWLPFSSKKDLLLTESQNICLDKPKWFVMQKK